MIERIREFLRGSEATWAPDWDDIERMPTSPDLEKVDAGEEAGVKAMYGMAPEPEVAPTVYGGDASDGTRQITVRVPPASPVNARRIWLGVCEIVARECIRVGIPVEGETTQEFVKLVQERGLTGSDLRGRSVSDPEALTEAIVDDYRETHP